MDTQQILKLAGDSALSKVNWSGRGTAPKGYIKGMALTFAQVYVQWKAGDKVALVMAQANTNDDNRDALSWYNSNFHSIGRKNDQAGADTLRHLFMLLIGLGMRESSGRYCEGRDRSASNTSADSAEAGLFQMSWDAHVASPELPKLLEFYQVHPDDSRLVFSEGVNCTAADLSNYGQGQGAEFQRLCKLCPGFAVRAAAVGLRTIGGKAPHGHWGPIRRKEAELRPEADVLLRQVQDAVDGTVSVFDPGVVVSATPPATTIPTDRPEFPPKPAFGPLVSNDARGALFGRFTYASAPTSDNPEHIKILGGWQEANIVWVPIPQMAKRNLGEPGARGGMLFHRLGKAQLLGMWDAWEKAGLLDRLLEFDGSFAPRFVRGSRVNLSNHAFGSAFDVNYQWNQLGAIPALVGHRGSVRELVPIANRWGFFWGGHYEARKDGMHFELAKLLPASPVLVQVPAPTPPVVAAPTRPAAPLPTTSPSPATPPAPAPKPTPWWLALLEALFHRKA